MLKFIGTKKYNTQTARLISRAGDQELYRKRGGEFFLALPGENKIVPMSYDEASIWMAEHMDPEAAAAVFSGGKPQTTCFTLSGEAMESLKRMAADQGKPMSKVAEDAILAYAGGEP